MTELRTKGYTARDNGNNKLEERLTDLDIAREFVRWGVKGDTLDHGMEWETETYRGKEYKVCPASVIDVYEYNEWLQPLYVAIMKFNSLDAEKKRQSSRNAGTMPRLSTVKPADSSPG